MKSNKNNFPLIKIKAQYMKYLNFKLHSVENLEKMSELIVNKKKPDIKINIGVSSNQKRSELDEITLSIEVIGRIDEKNDVFKLNVSYSGLFLIRSFDKIQKEMICTINAPSFLFPFARQIVSDTMKNGGLPPLMIDPIDFGGLFLSKNQIKGTA